MRIPRLQSDAHTRWLELLANKKAHNAEMVNQLKADIEQLQLDLRSPNKTEIEVEQHILIYTRILTTALGLVGGYEREAIKQAAKTIASEMLIYISQNPNLLPAMQAIGMVNYQPDEHFADEHQSRNSAVMTLISNQVSPDYVTPMAMVFDPATNNLHFLATLPILDTKAGPVATEQNQTNQLKRSYKIFNPTASPSVDSEDDETESSTAVKSKPQLPGTVIEGALPTGFNQDNVYHLTIQQLRHAHAGAALGEIFWLWQQRSGNISVTTFDEATHAIQAPIPAPRGRKITRTIYHPRRNMLFRLYGDKQIDVLANGKLTEHHTFATEHFPAAVVDIAISPKISDEGEEYIAVLLANGGVVPCKLIPNKQRGVNPETNEPDVEYGRIAQGTIVYEPNGLIANSIQWINNEEIIIQNNRGLAAVFLVSTQDDASVMAEHRKTNLKPNYKTPLLYAPFTRRDLDDSLNLKDKYIGVIVTQKDFGGNALYFYKKKAKGEEFKFYVNKAYCFAVTGSKAKCPIGICISHDNLFLAIRYSDGSIDVVDMQQFFANKSEAGLRKATHSISATGEALGGYRAS